MKSKKMLATTLASTMAISLFFVPIKANEIIDNTSATRVVEAIVPYETTATSEVTRGGVVNGTDVSVVLKVTYGYSTGTIYSASVARSYCSGAGTCKAQIETISKVNSTTWNLRLSVKFYNSLGIYSGSGSLSVTI